MNSLKDVIPMVLGKDMKLHEFEGKYIYESLIRETDLSEKDAQLITRETIRMLVYIFRKEKFAKNPTTGTFTKIEGTMKHLSGPFIRALAGIKLKEYGFEIEQLQYTRVGIPKFDLEKMIKENPQNKLNGEVTNHIITENNNINQLIKDINNGSNKKES